MAGRATYAYLLCVALGKVSDIHQALKVIILSPDYSRVLLSSGKNNAVSQRELNVAD